MTDYSYDWADLAFGSKKPINQLNATFIATSRELSPKRFTELVKEYLPKGNIVVGITNEDFILGFEGQPQFRTLKIEDTKPIIDKVNKSLNRFKIYTLAYNQRETKYLIEKLKFGQILFVNGSWKYAFHGGEIFYTLVSNKIDYKLISPFTGEDEAKEYLKIIEPEIDKNILRNSAVKIYSAKEMLGLASEFAKKSFDYNHQTATVLGIKSGEGYKVLALAYNKIVPYNTYALHFGSVREKNFSPANDLNYYDTNHAEVDLLIQVADKKIDLRGATIFINLLPCPACARMLSQTKIKQVIYQLDHSAGYAVQMLENSGKKVTLAK